jgi:hypothetical protein|tara:strand:- start:224 stop:688 length:465 start_codon:yes stop_codon:yes gene_type:complete
MAEVEYGGIKMSGGKLLIIIPLLGTLIGGMWGGFEVYNRLLDAEEKLEQLEPEQILNQVELFRTNSALELQNLQNLTTVIKDDLAGDILEASRLARSVEVSSASTQREVRNDVYAMEKEMQSRFKEMDKDIREMRKELEERIQTILENPLNDVE